MSDNLTPVVNSESICEGRAGDVDGCEGALRQKEAMFPGTIKELPYDVPLVVQPIRLGIRSSRDDIYGRKLTFREQEAMSPRRAAEQSHDLPLVIDAVRDRRPGIRYIEVLKS